jgi:hypothetical protein
VKKPPVFQQKTTAHKIEYKHFHIIHFTNLCFPQATDFQPAAKEALLSQRLFSGYS